MVDWLETRVLDNTEPKNGFTSFRVGTGKDGNGKRYHVTFPLELFLMVGDRIDFSNATLKPIEGRIGHADYDSARFYRTTNKKEPLFDVSARDMDILTRIKEYSRK